MVQAVDNDYWNDGTGFFNPNVRPGRATPATAAASPAPVPWSPEARYQGLLDRDPTAPVAAGATDAINGAQSRLGEQSDDLMDDWKEWMYPKLKDALAYNKNAADSTSYESGRIANNLDTLAEQTNTGANRLNQLNENMYIPQAQRVMDDANQFSRAGYAERAAQTALGDMGAAYQNERQAARMQMAQYGINPMSGRAQALDRSSRIMQGAQTAAAANRARSAAEEIWGKKQIDALGTSAAIGNNFQTIAGMRQAAGGMQTAGLNARKIGSDATDQYFGNVNTLGQTQAGIYDSANKGYESRGQLGLGVKNMEMDHWKNSLNDNTQRYGVDKNFEAAKYSADKQAEAARNSAAAQKKSSKSSAIGSIIGTGLQIWGGLGGL